MARNMIGERHGEWTIIAYDKPTHEGKSQVQIRCSCGYVTVRRLSTFRQGGTRCRGCHLAALRSGSDEEKAQLSSAAVKALAELKRRGGSGTAQELLDELYGARASSRASKEELYRALKQLEGEGLVSLRNRVWHAVAKEEESTSPSP